MMVWACASASRLSLGVIGLKLLGFLPDARFGLRHGLVGSLSSRVARADVIGPQANFFKRKK